MQGHIPLDCIFNYRKFNVEIECNGVTDSLRYLSFHDNYVKPWSVEFTLVNLLTQSF